MLSEKEKLEEELKLLEESFSLDVITKKELEEAKTRIEKKLKGLEALEQEKEIKIEEKPEEEVKEEPKTVEKEEIEEEPIIKYKDIKKEEEKKRLISEEKPKTKKDDTIKEPEEKKEEQKKLEEIGEEERPEEEVEVEENPEEEALIQEERPEIIIKGEKKSSKKIFAYIAIIMILVIGSWYFFFSGDNGVKDIPSDKPVGEIVSLIACNSDKECVKEGSIGICKNPGEENAECEYIEDARIKLTILNNDDCFNCETERVLGILKGLFPNMDIENIDFETEKGKEIIEKFNINALPAYIFDSNFKEAKNYDEFLTAFNEIDGSFVMKNTVSNANYYLEREEMPNKIDLFLKSDQVASSKAEKNLEEFLEAFKGKVVFEKHDGNSGIVKELGINSFPAFLVNNKIKFSGVQPADTIKDNFCEMNKLDECDLELSKSLV